MLRIPYPVPRSYIGSFKMSSIAKTLIRAYRIYLATEVKVPVDPVLKENIVKVVEETVASCVVDNVKETGDNEDERTEKLKKASKVNQKRWKQNEDVKQARLKKTRGLREMVIKMGVQ